MNRPGFWKLGALALLIICPRYGSSQEITLQDSVFSVGDKLIFEDIYWSFSTHGLEPESELILHSVNDFMHKYRFLTLEIGVHTDSRGTASINQVLSERRAQDIMNIMLEDQFLLADRLTFRGYGESVPIVSDSVIMAIEDKSERERAYQKNRRVEFKVTSTSYDHPDDGIYAGFFNEENVLRSYDILFMFDKDVIMDTSFAFLNDLADYLTIHSNLILEVSCHRDSRGSSAYCSKLTQRRAEAVVDYLIGRGVEQDRLIPVGYGESKLLITDSEIDMAETEEEKEWLHHLNRRIEFTVISMDYQPARE